MFRNIHGVWLVFLIIPCFGCQNEHLTKLQSDLDNLRQELNDQQTLAKNDVETRVLKLSESQQNLETKIASDIKQLLESYSPEMREQLKNNLDTAATSMEAIETNSQEVDKLLEHVSELVKQVEIQRQGSIKAASEIEKMRATTGGNGRYQLISGGEFSRSVGGGSSDPLASSPGLTSLYVVAVVDTSNAQMMVQASCPDRSEDAGANYEFDDWIAIPPPADLPVSIGRYQASVESGLGGSGGWYAIFRVLDTASGKMYRSTLVIKQETGNKTTTMLGAWETIENPHLKNADE